MHEACYLGVDLGGTKLRLGAVDADGRLVGEIVSARTGVDFGFDQLSARIATARALLASAGRDVAGVGIGVACVVRNGLPLTQCDNLPLLNDVPLAAAVGSATGRPVTVENDARCFVLAESRFGAARGASHVVGLTLGTGVGCGVVLDGRVHRGHHGEAGEACRIPLRGERIEHHVSGAGVVRAYGAAGGRDPLTDAAAVADAARARDQAAARAWESFGTDLAFLCQCIASLVDPECIVLGGSLAGARDLFDAVLRARLSGWPTRVVYSELGAAAGVIGAAVLCAA